MIYLLYGQPASGKTTLGGALARLLSTTFHIDGDEFRELFKNENYGRDGREKNIRAANVVATYLNKTQEKDVVLTFVNPYVHLRDELKRDNKGEVLEILLTSDRELRRDYHVKDFEEGEPDFSINTDGDIGQNWKILRDYVTWWYVI